MAVPNLAITHEVIKKIIVDELFRNYRMDAPRIKVDVSGGIQP